MSASVWANADWVEDIRVHAATTEAGEHVVAIVFERTDAVDWVMALRTEGARILAGRLAELAGPDPAPPALRLIGG